MSHLSIADTLPISTWHPALQAIVRCLEVMDGRQIGSWNYSNRNQYHALIANIESFLVTESKNDAWAMMALAELAMQDKENFEFIPSERGIPYLYKAAEAGYANAQLELASLGFHKKIPPRQYWGMELGSYNPDKKRWDDFNQKQSDFWLKEAAENGSADAQYWISDGVHHSDGTKDGPIHSDDPEIFAEGVKWLKKAARNKSPHCNAQYDLAQLMELKRIDPGLPEEQWALYEAAAKADIPEAMLAAGRYIENGIGVERDVNAAVKWYLKAAEWWKDKEYLKYEREKPYSEGYLRAGLLTENTRYLEKAAKAGHVEAMLILAPKMLSAGLFSDSFHSFQAGLDYFESAAAQGNLEAVLEIADIYENGWHGRFPDESEDIDSLFTRDGCERERLEIAITYYEQAQKLGWEYAQENIARIQTRLNKLQDEDDQED